MSRRRVGVLTDDEDFHLLEGVGEGPQDIRPRWKVVVPLGDFGAQHRSEFVDFRLNRREGFRPPRVNEGG